MSNDEQPGENISEEDSSGAEHGTASKLQLPKPPQPICIPGPDSLKALLPPTGLEMPEMCELGGEEAFPAYKEVFDGIYRSTKVIVDPRGYVIDFGEDACRHVCFAEERFDKRRKAFEGEQKTREVWQQVRAEYILWIYPALVHPVEILRNTQVRGNEAYLLSFPRQHVARPGQRYYVSVRPTGPKRRKFVTAFPIDQEKWNRARRGTPGQQHVLYQQKLGRW